MGEAKRDNNFVTTLLAVSSDDGSTPVTLYADPTTHRLLVSNGENFGTGTASTTDATETTLVTIALSDNTVYHLKGTVVGNKSDHTDRASAQISATAYRAGGSATIQGFTTSLHAAKSDLDWGDPTFSVSGNNLLLTVTGKAATNIDWSGIVYYLSV